MSNRRVSSLPMRAHDWGSSKVKREGKQNTPKSVSSAGKRTFRARARAGLCVLIFAFYQHVHFEVFFPPWYAICFFAIGDG